MEADRQRMLATASSAFSQAPNLRSPLPEIPDHKLICLIGRGAYGEVWIARNAIGTLRAVKVVYRQSFQHTEHFEREFKGLLKFEPISRSHAGFVDILQIGRREEAGYFYYVMELADDAEADKDAETKENSAAPYSVLPSDLSSTNYTPRTLRGELLSRGPLPGSECVTIGLKLTSALAYLHGNGLVHRDIKPPNIIFVNGEPKLADIGLVTGIDDARSLVGTAGYIPPEGPGTPQADLYSLGKVLYEISFGKDRQEFPQLPPALQSYPDYTRLLELNEIILRACETDPRNRYQSSEELCADLSTLERGGSVKRQRLWQRRAGLAARLGVVAAVIALLSLSWSFLNRSGNGHTPLPEAARLYEKGRWYYSQLTPEAHGKAFDYL